jgi:hypothetical protein
MTKSSYQKVSVSLVITRRDDLKELASLYIVFARPQPTPLKAGQKSEDLFIQKLERLYEPVV